MVLDLDYNQLSSWLSTEGLLATGLNGHFQNELEEMSPSAPVQAIGEGHVCELVL